MNNTYYQRKYFKVLAKVDPYSPSISGPDDIQKLDMCSEWVKQCELAFQSVNSIVQLSDLVKNALNQLHPSSGHILFVKKDNNYQPIHKSLISFDPNDLNISSKHSVARTFSECAAIDRRSVFTFDIYIDSPVINTIKFFLASEFDTCRDLDKMDYVPNLHMIEECSLQREYWSEIDTFPLMQNLQIRSFAFVPILEYKHTDPIGGLFLFPPKGIFNCFVDLVPLRKLADVIARPLKEIYF